MASGPRKLTDFGEMVWKKTKDEERSPPPRLAPAARLAIAELIGHYSATGFDNAIAGAV